MTGPIKWTAEEIRAFAVDDELKDWRLCELGIDMRNIADRMEKVERALCDLHEAIDSEIDVARMSKTFLKRFEAARDALK